MNVFANLLKRKWYPEKNTGSIGIILSIFCTTNSENGGRSIIIYGKHLINLYQIGLKPWTFQDLVNHSTNWTIHYSWILCIIIIIYIWGCDLFSTYCVLGDELSCRSLTVIELFCLVSHWQWLSYLILSLTESDWVILSCRSLTVIELSYLVSHWQWLSYLVLSLTDSE